MRTAILAVSIAGALAAMGWAQLAASSTDKPKEGKRSTYEVIVDGKVVAKGHLTNSRSKPASVEVKIDGKSVVRTFGAHGAKRTLILSGDGKLPGWFMEPNAKGFTQMDREWSPERMKWLQDHIAKIEQMLREHFGPGQDGAWVWPRADLDPKALQNLQKSMELNPETLKKLRDLTELKVDGFKDGSTFLLPGKGLRLVDPGNGSMPTVKFEEDGSYKVLLRGKTLAEGKVEPKESRNVSVVVVDGKYRVEINGKVVSEGNMPSGG